MISVCLTSYNGSSFINEQIESILKSNLISELIISDDCSTDSTLARINSFNDSRIKVYSGVKRGVVKNFEFVISKASGDFIFLSDQDDVWLDNKVETCLKYLANYDVVVSNCYIVDQNLIGAELTYFDISPPKRGLLSNLLINHYLGCCLCFRKAIIPKILPFPTSIPMHDWWIGVCCESIGTTIFIDEPLILYRRHGGNFSSTAEKSKSSFLLKIKWRISILANLIVRLMKLL